MRFIQANDFARVVKKLSKQMKAELDLAVKAIMDNPVIGEAKTADLAGIRVYKFKLNTQLTLLGYEYEDETLTLYLLKVASIVHACDYREP